MDAVELQQLIDEHYARIRRAALAMCGDPWEADEITQETFLRVYSLRDTFREESAIETWLYAICLRVHRSRFRSLIRSVKRAARWTQDHGKHESSLPTIPLIESEEWRDGIWRQVRELPVRQREVVVLRFAEELSIADIATTLDCPEGTVKSRLHHGLASLKRILERDEDFGQDGTAFTEEASHRPRPTEPSAAPSPASD